MRVSKSINFPKVDIDSKSLVISLKKLFENTFKVLTSFHRDIHQDINDLETIYTETAPNGNLKSKRGKIAIYWTGAAYQSWQNVDGEDTWIQLG